MAVDNAAWIAEDGQLRFFRAPRAVIVVADGDGAYQLMDVLFMRDGSLAALFPHLPAAPGLVAEATIPLTPPHTVRLDETGKVTGHVVKYTHHKSGRAHFSLTGSTTNEVGRESNPLSRSGTTIFHAHIYNPRGFAPYADAGRPKDRVYLPTLCRPALPTAFMITATWRAKTAILAALEPPGGEVGPIARVQHRATGAPSNLFLLGQPSSSPFPDCVLAIEVVETVHPAAMSGPSLVFVGGLDVLAPAAAPGTPTRGALVALYPSVAAEELRMRLGTIDIPPTGQP